MNATSVGGIVKPWTVIRPETVIFPVCGVAEGVGVFLGEEFDCG